MKVLVTESFNTLKGNIPAGKVVEIPDTMFNRLKGKVVAIPSEPETNTTVIWRNPYPQGAPEARQASLESMIEAMLYGLPPADDEQNRQINDMARDVLLGKAKLADFQRLLGFLH